jgi:hypothetical protein
LLARASGPPYRSLKASSGKARIAVDVVLPEAPLHSGAIIRIGGGLAASPSHTTVLTGPYTAVRQIMRTPVPAGGAAAGVWNCASARKLRSLRRRAVGLHLSGWRTGRKIPVFCRMAPSRCTYPLSALAEVEALIEAAKGNRHGQTGRPTNRLIVLDCYKSGGARLRAHQPRTVRGRHPSRSARVCGSGDRSSYPLISGGRQSRGWMPVIPL